MASTNPDSPDYTCPAYLDMEPRWAFVDDIRAGTDAMRARPDLYLPKFEAESDIDWAARIKMTFAADHYATTLQEHVGLVMAEPIKLGEDVPPRVRELTEDIDGEGNHLDVFATTAFDAGLHLGHCVLFTDYPVTANVKTRRDERLGRVRPYVQLYRACDVLSWKPAVVGGVQVLVQVVFRETTTVENGEFGVESGTLYREIKQQVFYDELTGRATGLGAITWRAWKEQKNAAGVLEKTLAGDGTITGPTRIPARVVYGGEKLGLLHSKPHLYGLALSNLEETQVGSDYAVVMHKCNVPTPVFVGRNPNDSNTVKMGHGIDVPIGGSAIMLEPAGTAIAATRTRLQDIQLRMRRQGASSAQGEGGPALTATAEAQDAKARNAKLRRAARSLQDALEGVLADMAAYMGIASTGAVKSGGSVQVTQDFAGLTLDPAYLTVLVTAYREGSLTMEELRAVLQTGKLPETFDADNVVELIVADDARRKQQELERKTQPPEERAA